MSDAVKLNLGSGEDIREDFINIDIQPFPGVDICTSICNLPMFEDSSVDFIVAQHVFEYIPRPNMLITLSEWRRILKDNTPLEIRVGDLEAITRSFTMINMDNIEGISFEMMLSFLYGKQCHQDDVIYNAFNTDYLEGILTGAGFKVINVVKEYPDIIITALKYTPELVEQEQVDE